MRNWTARIAPSVVLPGVLAAAACSGHTTAPSTTTQPKVLSIAVSPPSVSIAPGKSQLLTASVTADAGADTTLVWSASDPTAITLTAASGVAGTNKVSAPAVGGAAAPGLSQETKLAIINGSARPGDYRVTVASKADPTVSAASVLTVTGVDLTALYGTFNITANKSSDTGCNFTNTFSGQLQFSSPNTDGSAVTMRMIERLTRVYAGTVATNGTYTGTGTGNLDGFVYNGTISGTIGGNGSSLTGSETLNFTAGCPNRTVIYQFTGVKK